ncbi:conserved exported protein of unknown function [Tenacibaculum sp. 190524A02b]|uniref:hypothetical protein n=1 Tax=Tenacibaculum vairaonense TaxID=3137860 RepID=UPI0032B20342
MKKIIYFIAIIITTNLTAQTTDFFKPSKQIWVENFSTYSNGTGIDITNGSIEKKGDYTDSFTKWTIDATAINTSNTLLSAVNNFTDETIFNPSFNVANTEGELAWTSEEIDVSAFPQTHLSVVIETEGNLENDEYIDVYWKVVNLGNFILINRNDSGHTLVGNTNKDCHKAIKIHKDLTVTTPGKIQVKVVLKSKNINHILKIKKIEVLGKELDN